MRTMIKNMNLENLPKRGNVFDWKNSIGYKVHFIYDDIEGDIEIVDYERNKKYYITVKYNNKEWDIATMSFTSGFIGKIVDKVTGDFKIEIGTIFKDNKRDITIIDRKIKTRYTKNNVPINEKYYKYHCNKDGYEDWIVESNIFQGKSCSVCSNKVVARGINDIATTHPDLIKYFKNIEDAYKYTSGSGKKVDFKCPDCKEIINMTINKFVLHGLSCKKCSDGISYPNKFAYNLLQQLHIKFICEFSPDWCNYKINNKFHIGRYDFYIPSMNIIIEMDGGWHNKDNYKSRQTKEESKVIDNHKDELAGLHNIEVIRIDCDYNCVENRFEHIKQNIFKSKLNELFDMDSIDWIMIEKFCCNTRVKEACDLWNKGIHNTKEISDIMGLSSTTVCKYLKQGSKLNWNDYNAKKVMSNNGKMFCKQIKVFKNNNFIKLFNSITELINESENIFGVKLYEKGIRQVCYKLKQEYKGYYFEIANYNITEEIL